LYFKCMDAEEERRGRDKPREREKEREKKREDGDCSMSSLHGPWMGLGSLGVNQDRPWRGRKRDTEREIKGLCYSSLLPLFVLSLFAFLVCMLALATITVQWMKGRRQQE